jgi:hypothetical protein
MPSCRPLWMIIWQTRLSIKLGSWTSILGTSPWPWNIWSPWDHQTYFYGDCQYAVINQTSWLLRLRQLFYHGGVWNSHESQLEGCCEEETNTTFLWREAHSIPHGNTCKFFHHPLFSICCLYLCVLCFDFILACLLLFGLYEELYLNYGLLLVHKKLWMFSWIFVFFKGFFGPWKVAKTSIVFILWFYVQFG